jgi:16S rRNA processing protein RimM
VSKQLFKADSQLRSELLGLKAQLADSRTYGKVVAIYDFGAGEVIELQLMNGKTEILPLKAAFVGEINTAKGYIIIYPPEYLEAKEEK